MTLETDQVIMVLQITGPPQPVELLIGSDKTGMLKLEASEATIHNIGGTAVRLEDRAAFQVSVR